MSTLYVPFWGQERKHTHIWKQCMCNVIMCLISFRTCAFAMFLLCYYLPKHSKSVCGSALKRVQVWSHTFANAQKFVDEQTRRNEYIEFFSCSTVQQAVEGADIINTVTASAVPILEVPKFACIHVIDSLLLTSPRHIHILHHTHI